uniref:Conjugal transfer protein n=1 Tax=Streptomyces sp. NBC_00049 TaxID=2903617 RepID=A0AAU2JQX7_9ACTN
MGETDSMTDHNSSAGGVDGGQPSGQQGQFGSGWPAGAQQPPQAQGQQAPQSQPQVPNPYGYADGQQAPQQHSSDARAQVAAAWVRTARPGPVPPGEAAVPVLPPQVNQPSGGSKKDQRKAAQDAKRAERKAAYEQKKAEREGRKKGRGNAAPAPTAAQPVAASAPAASGPTASAAPQATAPARTAASAGEAFDVPRPGGRLPAQGRRTHVAVRAALLITTCVFALGSCGVAGLVIGKSSVAVQSADLNEEDLQRYRLTEFPVTAAATFAEEYVTLCMTYSPQNADKRREALTRYASSGVDRDCGMTGQGTQNVRQAKWDGTVEDLPEYGANGRYLGIQVKLTNGRITTLSVPVYVKDPASGSGLRIAGNVGEMPVASRGSVPVVKQDDEVVDRTLSDQLKTKVLPGYFKAWAASDATGLTRFTSTDASPAATAGLAGVLASPEVQDVVALAPADTEPNAEITYGQGQTVQARVTVVWGGAGAAPAKGTPAPTTTVKRSYRLTVVNTPQGWFIKDIRGGVLDPTGGTADTGATTPGGAAPEEPPAAGDGAPAAPAASGAPKTP